MPPLPFPPLPAGLEGAGPSGLWDGDVREVLAVRIEDEDDSEDDSEPERAVDGETADMVASGQAQAAEASGL